MPPTAPGKPTEGEWSKDQACEFYNNYDCKEVLGKGMSSTVRRCIRFSTGEEFAVKIIDLSSEKATAEQVRELRDSTLREIKILQMFSGHKNISVQFVLQQLMRANAAVTCFSLSPRLL
ncbi:Pkinase domain containing protein [Trichuris trichiura]|uniref:Pkinase domain containing protein n=1 Tax=Trichuris trichiura TaxID=36087 RepID=A0A077ZNC1_TRITR|nr:Pkinase domain containing protein [Trichuris trichiura]